MSRTRKWRTQKYKQLNKQNEARSQSYKECRGVRMCNYNGYTMGIIMRIVSRNERIYEEIMQNTTIVNDKQEDQRDDPADHRLSSKKKEDLRRLGLVKTVLRFQQKKEEEQ